MRPNREMRSYKSREADNDLYSNKMPMGMGSGNVRIWIGRYHAPLRPVLLCFIASEAVSSIKNLGDSLTLKLSFYYLIQI